MLQSCQSQSWKRHHKHECPVLKTLGAERQLPNAVRAVIQTLVMRKSGLISDEDWENLQELPAHLDELRQEPDWDKHAVLALGALKYSMAEDKFSSNIATGIYGRVRAHSMCIFPNII